MRKLLSTIIFLLALATTLFAQDGGLLKYGENITFEKENPSVFEKTNHNATVNDWHSDHEVALYGTGAAVLVALGVGYGVARKNKQKKN